MMLPRHLRLLLTLLGAACDDAAGEPAPLPTPETSVATARDEQPAPSPATIDAGAPDPCEELQDEARALLASSQSCERDADCIVKDTEIRCLLPFLCPVPINAQTDIGAFRTRAAILGRAYRNSQCPCAVARCISPESLRVSCNPISKRCESSLKSHAEEAGVTQEASDADASAAVAP